jgi:hypothetical protein
MLICKPQSKKPTLRGEKAQALGNAKTSEGARTKIDAKGWKSQAYTATLSSRLVFCEPHKGRDAKYLVDD